MVQEDVITIEFRTRGCANGCINPPLIFEPVLAIVCNIACAHTVTRGRVNPRAPGSFAVTNFLPLGSRAIVFVVQKERDTRAGEMLAHGAPFVNERLVPIVDDAPSRRARVGGHREVEVDAL